MSPSAGASARPFKRRRFEDYPRGSVMRVDMHNFMTYKHVTVEPGPKLNLVIGPNGTGKSSLVCAICVGLGGKTTLLGRAEDVSSYVRRGADSGWVEITLSSGDPARPHVVRREIRREGNSSEWFINRTKCRLKDVEELVRDRLKVQLDNLCQFLPQDRVVEFARMKPVDLLEATEKAIGAGELHAQHRQLVDVRRQLAEHDTHKAALEESLAQLRAENARNTRDVENIQRQQALRDEAELARGKLPWVQYEQRRRRYTEQKKARDDAKQQLAAARRRQAEDEGPLAARSALLQRLQARKAALDGELKAADAQLTGSTTGRQPQQGLEQQVADALEEVQAKQQEIAGLAEAADRRDAQVARLQAEVERLQAEVEALPPLGNTGELAAARRQLQEQQRDVGVQASALDLQLEEVFRSADDAGRRRRAAEQRLRRADDAKEQRLRVLEQRHPNIYQAWRWLKNADNRARFRGPVFGPIAVEVDCPDARHAQHLEQQVATIVWSFFVVQHHEDQDLLKEELGRLGHKAAVCCYTGDVLQPIPHPRGEAAQYARFGVVHTLDAVFGAAPVVKRVLVDEARLNEAFVAERSDQVEQLFREADRVQMLYTPDCCYRRKRSQYNRAAESTLVSDVRPARLLAGAGGADDGSERAACAAELAACDQELRGLEEQRGALRQQRAGVQAQLDKLKARVAEVAEQERALNARHTSMRTSLRGKQNELARLARAPSPREREPRLRLELEQASGRALSKALAAAQLCAAQTERLAAAAAADLGAREAQQQIDRIKAAVARREAELRELQAAADVLAQACSRAADECRRLKAVAEASAPLDDALQAAWSAADGGAGLPDDEEALQRFIALKSDEAEGMVVANPAALRQYQQRLRQVAEQQAALAQLEERRSEARATIDEVKAAWLPELQRIVAAVNATFSASFTSVGCAGDVVLHEAPDEGFERYAIEIRVKFRDAEQLQTLDANRQSGGERSVSTVLYLIALQGVTVTPFRVVDEINQGMDPVNERKVFMRLVEAACRPHTPQCFLLTPKLLPDLPFTRDVTVLQIVNGSHVGEVATGFKLESLMGERRLAALAAA